MNLYFTIQNKYKAQFLAITYFFLQMKFIATFINQFDSIFGKVKLPFCKTRRYTQISRKFKFARNSYLAVLNSTISPLFQI